MIVEKELRVVVAVRIQYDDSINIEEIIDDVGSNMDYDFTYKTPTVQIINTEILEVE